MPRTYELEYPTWDIVEVVYTDHGVYLFILYCEHAKYFLANEHHRHARLGIWFTVDFENYEFVEDMLPYSVDSNSIFWTVNVVQRSVNDFILIVTETNRYTLEQKIVCFSGPDNIQGPWTRVIGEELVAKPPFYNFKTQEQPFKYIDFRDPHFFIAGDNDYRFLFSATDVGYPVLKTGCVGQARLPSANLTNLSQAVFLPPLFDSKGRFEECEVPQIFRNTKNNNTIITFSCWAKNDRSSTTVKGGLYSVPVAPSFTECTTDAQVNLVLPEDSYIYAARPVYTPLGFELVGFDFRTGGIRRSGVIVDWEPLYDGGPIFPGEEAA